MNATTNVFDEVKKLNESDAQRIQAQYEELVINSMSGSPDTAAIQESLRRLRRSPEEASRDVRKIAERRAKFEELHNTLDTIDDLLEIERQRQAMISEENERRRLWTLSVAPLEDRLTQLVPLQTSVQIMRREFLNLHPSQKTLKNIEKLEQARIDLSNRRNEISQQINRCKTIVEEAKGGNVNPYTGQREINHQWIVSCQRDVDRWEDEYRTNAVALKNVETRIAELREMLAIPENVW
jgi:hypothetical protein